MKTVFSSYLLLLTSIVTGACLCYFYKQSNKQLDDFVDLPCSQKHNNYTFVNEFEPLLSMGFDLSAYTISALRVNEQSIGSNKGRKDEIDIYSLSYFDEVKLNNSKTFESVFNNNLINRQPIVGFKNLLTSMRVNEQHKLASCGVPKTMSTLMAAIQCYIKYPDKEFQNYPYCDKEISYHSVDQTRQGQNLTSFDGWKLIFIKRDPMDRFLSGFMDRCVRVGKDCLGCYSNIQCFLERLYLKFQSIVEDREEISYDEYHMAPQTWNCELPRTWKNIRFIRYSSDPTETLLKDLMPVFDELKIPKEQQVVITNGLTTLRTNHSTVDSPIRAYMEDRLKSSPYLYNLLRLIYDSDYKLLGFKQ